MTSRGVGSVGLYTQPVFSIGQVSISHVSDVAPANVEARGVARDLANPDVIRVR
jgi:hypothetical protein